MTYQPQGIGLLRVETVDPTAGAGFSAPPFTFLLNTTDGSLYIKTGAANTAWTLLAVGSTIDPAFSSVFGDAWFGSGFDGDVTISAPTTLARDMHYNNLTIDAGVDVNNGAFRVFVKNTLTLNGKISRNGNIGAANASGSVNGGAGGAALSQQVFNSSRAGGAGGGGAGGAPAAPASTSVSALGYLSGAPSINANGGLGQGGSGGKNSAGSDGIQGGTVGIASAADGNAPYNIWQLYTFQRAIYASGKCETGTGGGGGRGGAAGGNGSGSPGGGGSAGIVGVYARKIVGSGSLEAVGGAGGVPFTGGPGTNAGGSGGGAGGATLVLIGTGSFPTQTLTGGNGGAGTGSGINGFNGGSGISINLRLGAN